MLRSKALFLTLVLLAPCAGAQVARLGSGSLVVVGPIKVGDAAALAVELVAGPKPDIVGFKSPGGALSEGLAIGELLRAFGVDSAILGECASACTIAASGGVKRFIGHEGTFEVHQISYLHEEPSYMAGDVDSFIEHCQHSWGRSLGYLRRMLGDAAALNYIARALPVASHTDLYIYTDDELAAAGFVRVLEAK